MTRRAFRFAVTEGGAMTSGEAWTQYARKVESLGYSTLSIGQHLSRDTVGQIAALATAAAATTSLRIASHPFPIDFYRPAVLALEAATLDLLSNGRLEFGVGAGWLGNDYVAAGIPFDPPGVRIARLEEAVTLFKRLLQGEVVTFTGKHYQVSDLILGVKPVQQPRPPIFVGGGRKRMLSLAGREADIVGLDMTSTTGGTMEMRSWKFDAMAEMATWVQEAAGNRFDDVELHGLIHRVVVTDDRRRAAEEMLQWISSFPPSVLTQCEMSVDDVLETPHALIGTVDQISETLRERREQLGLSYYTVVGQDVDAFAPVVAKLAGT
jgi:probable F420-dependent oxidoreductase